MPALPPLYPLVFTPVYKNYIWGGDRIIRRYRRQAPPGVYAESWEVSDRPEAMSLVANGLLAGWSLETLVRDYGSSLVGTAAPSGRFPLLLKILDARERLSVQVHPDEAAAKTGGGEQKNEAWYVLEAEPGAAVLVGARDGVKEGQLRQALRAGTVGELLNPIPVVAGDVVYIPAGCVHSVGAGCLLLEVQQNSDTTFRLFDWKRLGADGRPRALQIKQGLQAMRWQTAVPERQPAPAGQPTGGLVQERCVSPYFRMEQMTVATTLAGSTAERSFHILFVADGSVKVKANNAIVAAEAGTTILVPAVVGIYEVTGQGAMASVLRVSLP
jgi:mannose-6-phosphate isomerase